MTKFIVVTGGVLSGLGKGIAVASIGHLLSYQYKVIPVKLDGYLNLNPGTINPIEHGEVFVLDDGGEVDMDFGHYERFMGVNCKSEWNLTMGKVYSEILKNEREGVYLGQTVQIIPHVSDYIKNYLYDIAKKENPDILIIEIGGTVGDIENELFLEAVRQMKEEIDNHSFMFIHLTYIPILNAVNEQKSKPTQQSVNLLREAGIQPDMIIGRCSELISDVVRKKISVFCGIKKDAVITGLDVDSVYKIPVVFYDEGLTKVINQKLNINATPYLENWKKLIINLKDSNKRIKVGICGKYTKLEDSYASVLEALRHCEANLRCKIDLEWIETSEDNIIDKLKSVDGVIVPGGFGSRGVEGKIEAIKYVRENDIPFLGLCFGMQLAVVEFSRNICGLENANSSEVDPDSKYFVVDLLPEQRKIIEKSGTMRLGGQDVYIKENTKAYRLFGENIRRRFRHRYEVNPEYVELLTKNGLSFSGTTKSGNIMQLLELKDKKFFMAGQFHPELTSSLNKPDEMFLEFVRSCVTDYSSDSDQSPSHTHSS